MSEQKGLTPEERADLLRMLRYGAMIVGAVAVMIIVWSVLSGVFNFEVGSGRGVTPEAASQSSEVTTEATPDLGVEATPEATPNA